MSELLTPVLVEGTEDTYLVGTEEVVGLELAQKFADSLNKIIQAKAEAEALAPRNPRDVKLMERMHVFRDNLRELPMNETHMPDGSLNPMYDPEYYYAWASYTNRSSVGEHQGKGYKLVTMKDFKDLIKRNKCHDFYLNVLREEGNYLVFDTDILMRVPRLLREQTIVAENKKRATEIFSRVDKRNYDSLANAGAKMIVPENSNEVTVNFR